MQEIDKRISEEEFDRLWDSLSIEKQDEILRHAEAIEDNKKDWSPLPGPQTQAYHSKADILFYGGSAGAGKTDLILGLAHKEHKKSIIFRREYKQLKGIIDRGKELFEARNLGKFNAVQNFWLLKDKRVIELGACQHLGDEQKFQGIAHDLKAFDEITHYQESQFRFLCGWLRSTDSRQRKRVVCAGNPPTSSDGDWVIKFWGPWLDEHHPNPALPGELRWFTTINGEDVDCGAEPFRHDGELIVPRSRTFIPGTVNDNPYLLESGYKSTLQGLPEPLRSKMLYGDFTAGREDDSYQVIPTEWVRLAQQRWRETPKPDMGLSAIGVDVARGGADNTVITKIYGKWVGKQIVHAGKHTPDGGSVAMLVVKELNPLVPCRVTVDIIGVGGSVYDVLRGTIKNNYQRNLIVGFNGAGSSNGLDKTKMLYFINKRAEWYWKLREALDPETGDGLCLPDDRELLSDLCAARWELRSNGIKIEAKEDIVKRIGRSPDKADSLVYAYSTPPQGVEPIYNTSLLGR